MGLRTPQEFVASLKKLDKQIYMFGEKLEDWTEHPIIKSEIRQLMKTFELAQLDEYRDIMTMDSTLIGERVSRYIQLHTSIDDLIKRNLLSWEVELRIGSCHGARCGATHGINAVWALTYEIDKDLGTDYHARFKRWLSYVQHHDLTTTLASADARGDRSKRPSEQLDPDVFTHIVEKKRDGIVLRGAKIYQSMATEGEWHVIMPYGAAREGEESLSLCCAVPAGTKGITYIHEWPVCNAARILDGADIDLGISRYGIHGASIIIFEDVFVPYENVFLCGELEYGYQFSSILGRIQRVASTCCKAATIQLMAGAAALAAQSNGLDWRKVYHIRDKIVRIITLAAQCRGTALGACALATEHPSGIFLPDEIMANSAKLLQANAFSEATKLLNEIAGGLIGTMPSERDLKNPATRQYIEKYLKASPDVSVEDRMRIMRICEYLYGGSSTLAVCSMHTGVSPEAQKMVIANSVDMDQLENFVKELANIG